MKHLRLQKKIFYHVHIWFLETELDINALPDFSLNFIKFNFSFLNKDDNYHKSKAQHNKDDKITLTLLNKLLKI